VNLDQHLGWLFIQWCAAKVLIYIDSSLIFNEGEHEKWRIENPRVGGSIPPLATIIQNRRLAC
jgi:hypothetical protein